MKKRTYIFISAVAVIAILLTIFFVTRKKTEGHLTFQTNEDKSGYTVIDCADDASGELEIPSTYKGKPVTAVGNAAFRACKELTEITIPDSVTIIDSEAFYECTALAEIIIPDSVTKIYESAFECCDNLDNVFYCGSESQWKQIEIHEWNEALASAYTYFKCSGKTNTEILRLESGDTRDLAVASGDIVKMTAAVTGINLEYQWQSSSDGESWVDCTNRANKEQYNLLARLRHNGECYRCEITDAKGKIVYTNVLFLKVTDKEEQTATQPVGEDNANSCTVTAVNAVAGVKVMWDATPGAASYNVCRSTFADDQWSEWEEIATNVSETLFVDTIVVPAARVKYTVRTNNGSYKESAELEYLVAPVVTAVNATAGVKVMWDQVPGAENYNVYRSVFVDGKFCEWVKIATDVMETVFMDKSAEPNAIVKYTVRAASGDERSSYKGGNAVRYLVTPTVTAVNITGGVLVTWDDVPGAENYNIYRSTHTGEKWTEWERIATGVTGTTHMDTNVAPNTEVKYTVRAVNGDQKSSYEGGNTVKTN